MERIRVNSSNLASLGWKPGPPPWVGTLEVEFVRNSRHGVNQERGAVYRYRGVPASVALRVLMGELLGSVGSTFHFLVRRVDYPYERTHEEVGGV